MKFFILRNVGKLATASFPPLIPQGLRNHPKYIRKFLPYYLEQHEQVMSRKKYLFLLKRKKIVLSLCCYFADVSVNQLGLFPKKLSYLRGLWTFLPNLKQKIIYWVLATEPIFITDKGTNRDTQIDSEFLILFGNLHRSLLKLLIKFYILYTTYHISVIDIRSNMEKT